LGIGAPIGWWVLSSFIEPSSRVLYGYLTLSTTAIFGAFGYVLGRLLEQMKKLAIHDGLTGLLNQTTFFELAAAHFNLARRAGRHSALIILDADNFKVINDNHSHLFGSYVITQMAEIIKACCRASDLCARFGGDEFVLYLPDTGLEGAVAVGEKIRKKIACTNFSQGPFNCNITTSVGVGHSPCGPNADLHELTASADKMLYKAKGVGKDRVESHSLASRCD